MDQSEFKLVKACGRPEEDKGCEQLTKMDPQMELYGTVMYVQYIVVWYGMECSSMVAVWYS